ncbi:hypothetical protein ON010_g12188 [Phytophthora cinnamomi]|nr:hypothetical protein ON010_g12188 [Phytophthora cinnamomi]
MDLTHSEEAAPVVAPGTGYATPSTSMQCAVATNPADASSGSAASSTSSGTGPVAGGEGSSAAPASIVPAGVPPPTPTRTPKTPSQPPKPVRKLFSSRVVVAQKSICFSTEGVATALDVTPDGEIVVVGFTDGSVRLYEMDSSVPSDRHGYLLGHIDEQSSQGSFNVHLRVKISPDGRYVFVGCRHTQPRVIMSINLDHYRSEKDGDDDDFQQFQKHFHSSSRVRGFADVTTYVPPADQVQETKDKRSAYYILTGLGVGTLNLWRFIEPYQHQEPIWEHLQHFGAGGNTAMTAAFLPSSLSPGVLAIAAACKDKNMRVWPLEFQKASSSSASDSNNDSAAEGEDTDFLGGVHTVNTHFTIQNTPDIGNAAIHGQHAYGISLMGEAYRICLPDASTMNAKSCERLPRQEFELEKIDGNGSSKSRRSNIMLESLAASDDGKAVVAVSTDGIFYYSNDLPAVGSDDVVNLRIIGKNASENALYKAPMKVYTPVIISNGKKTKSEAMMAVVTNPGGEDSDEVNGYINVDPTEGFAARWMVPSRGSNCWVCGVRNVRHWIGPPESKTKSKEPTRAQLMAEEKERKKVLLRRERALKKAQDTTARQRSSSNGGDPDTPSSAKTRTPRVKPSAPKQKDVQSDASADSGSGTPRLPPPGKRRRISQTSGAGDDDDDEGTGSDDNTPSVASLMNELEHFKKRNAEIKTEWQRRLLGERQLRRKWKQREEEFLEQLNDSLTKLDATEVEVGKLRVLLRDAEKRFAFEKARAEQENSVKVRYDQLCEQMNEKMALVSDQKRLLEQTTRSLLAEVDRNVHALKNAVILEKTDAASIKQPTASTPCIKLRRSAPSKSITGWRVPEAMEAPLPSPSSTSDYVRVVSTPTVTTPTAPPAPDVHAPDRPRWVLYANVLVSLLQPLQYGWSTTQLNLTAFNNEDECDARPVAPGTCLMFPEHTKAQWTIAVSAWIVGGMIGALVCGRFSNKFGRKRIMMSNCLFMIAGAVVQASASSVWMFIGGRVISGIASGGATAVIPGFISEISPPNLRNSLGVGFQIAITVGNLLVAITFFFTDTSSGWRYIAGFPVVLALLFLALAPVGATILVKKNVYLAKTWIKQDHPAPRVASASEYIPAQQNTTPTYEVKPCNFAKLFSPLLIRQLLTAIGVAGAQQLTGINAVFFYSSTLFEQAGISDDRIGIVAVNFVNVLPTMFCGMLAARLGNRKLILYGLTGMFFSAVGITVSLVASLPALAIVFTACYVTTFGSSLGSLAWVVMADLFPDDVRAMGNSVCVGCSWLSNLAVGLGYPYIAAALVNFSFTPFMCTVALSFLFVYTVVPDTSGKTMQEIQDEFNTRRLSKK